MATGSIITQASTVVTAVVFKCGVAAVKSRPVLAFNALHYYFFLEYFWAQYLCKWAFRCLSWYKVKHRLRSGVAILINAHEQTQSNWVCDFILFVAFGNIQGPSYSYFAYHSCCVLVPCGGCKKSPRTRIQCCYYFVLEYCWAQYSGSVLNIRHFVVL